MGSESVRDTAVVYPDFIRNFLMDRNLSAVTRQRGSRDFLMWLNSFLESPISGLWKSQSIEAESEVAFGDVRYFSECELLNLRAGGVLRARWLVRNCELLATIEDDFASDKLNITENMIWDPLRTFVLNFALSNSGDICVLEFIDPDGHVERSIRPLLDEGNVKKLGLPLIAPILNRYARDPRDLCLPPNWRPRAGGHDRTKGP